MDIDDMVYTYSGVLFCNEKKGNPSICNEMDGPWEHCAKWDKSSRERQTLYNITYVWNLKKKKTCDGHRLVGGVWGWDRWYLRVQTWN